MLTGLIISARVVSHDREGFEKMPEVTQMLLLFSFLVCVAFTIFVLPLVVFHTYLVSQNLTSWEFLSWMRITYMKVWPKKYGSPFSKGVRNNWKMFFSYNYRK